MGPGGEIDIEKKRVIECFVGGGGGKSGRHVRLTTLPPSWAIAT